MGGILEFIPAIASAGIGMFGQILALKSKQQQMLLQVAIGRADIQHKIDKQGEKSVQNAREFAKHNPSWVRKTTALLLVIAFIAIVLSPYFGIPTVVRLDETTSFLGMSWQNTYFEKIDGILLQDGLFYLVQVVVGFYFGKGAIKSLNT